MRQPIIAVASTVTGLAVMAFVLSFQRDRSMWTHAAAATESATKAAAAPVAQSATKEPPAPPVGIVTLPAVVITASPPAARAEEKLDIDTLAPCSEWREVGPTYIEEGKAHGTRRVRSLC